MALRRWTPDCGASADPKSTRRVAGASASNCGSKIDLEGIALRYRWGGGL
ncbi:MAG: hypothetical protein IT294_01985 [Deltaproteobacteria bacterium]|nr:hypothetical protein [Deltaproteobacteria bacterium]